MLASYLWGALPTSYLVARFVKGIDIREYGSGNVGAANLMAHVGKRIGFLTGAFDCLAKGAVPILIARLFDQGLALQAAIGLAAIAGHNWSIYIRLTGGRGVATAIGSVIGLLMWQEFLLIGLFIGLIGRVILHETGLGTLLALFFLPVFGIIINRPPEMIYFTIAMGLLIVIKRLTANWETPTKDYPLYQVLACRLVWDRDVPRRVEWTSRHPSTS